jgi:hypothetical protein
MRHAKNDDIRILPCIIVGRVRLIATGLLNHERLLKPAALEIWARLLDQTVLLFRRLSAACLRAFGPVFGRRRVTRIV